MVSRTLLQNKSDEEMVSLVLQDQDNYLILMERYESKLFSYIKRLTGLPNEDVEDILQDVFIKVYRNLNSFDQKLKFSSWIYRIAHNESISFYRKTSSRPKTISTDESELLFRFIASKQNVAKDAEKKSLAKNVHSILSDINKKYRDVLVLKYLEEKDYKEISDILQKPMGTVATLLNRAKKEFKKAAGKYGVSL